MCGKFDAGTDCQAYEEQNWANKAASWADHCDVCPDGIVESRFTGICLSTITDTPCSSMHGLTTVTAVNCDLAGSATCPLRETPAGSKARAAAVAHLRDDDPRALLRVVGRVALSLLGARGQDLLALARRLRG